MLLKWIYFLPLSLVILIGCTSNPFPHDTDKMDAQLSPKVKSHGVKSRIVLNEAIKIHNENALKMPNYFLYNSKFFDINGSEKWDKAGVINQKTRSFNLERQNAVMQPLSQTMTYWLIKETKRKIKDDYFHGRLKKANKQHKFKPHLYGGSEGLATIFPITDYDIESYTNFTMFLNNKTSLDERNKQYLINVCFPGLTFYELRTNKNKPSKLNSEDECAYMLRDKGIAFYGIPIKHKEKTRIVETFVEEDPSFDTGFFHHLFNTPHPKNSDWLLKDTFPLLQAPEHNKYLISLSMDNRFVLDTELSFRDAHIVAQIRNELFSAKAVQTLVGDSKLNYLYNNYDLNMVQTSGYMMPKTGKQYQLFDHCNQKPLRLAVAYEAFTRIEYECFEGGKPKRHRKWATSFYYKPQTLKADVTFTALNEDDLLLSSYEQIPTGHSGYFEINNIDTSIESNELTNQLISKQLHYSFLSWVSVEGDKVYGNVEFYGMLFKYNLTKFVKWKLNSLIDNFDDGKSYQPYGGVDGWQSTLKLFPDLLEKHQRKMAKYN